MGLLTIMLIQTNLAEGVSVKILDDDLPTVSISAPDSALEGEPFEVTVESSFIALAPDAITVNLAAENTTGTYFKSLSDARDDLAGNQVEISGQFSYHDCYH